MTVQQKNIPALRFPEFSEKWSKCNVGEITKKVGKKNKDRISYPIYSINNINGFNPQSEQFDGIDSNVRGFDISLYKIVDNRTFAYNPARINVGSIGYNYDLGNVIVSSLYVCFKTVESIDDFFLYLYFKSYRFNKEVEKHGEGGVRIYLFYESLSKIKFAYPTKSEQQKIADFLTAVDERIQQLTRKKELLEQYKKGVMQRIFSQQIRFKDDNGNDYPDWEEKRLGALGATYNGLTGKTAIDFGRGKPFITYMQVFAKSKIDISKVQYVEISDNENQNTVEYGDILFTTSSETQNEVGLVSGMLEDREEVYLNSFCFGFRPFSLDVLLPEFAQYLFRNNIFRDDIYKLAQGSTRYNLSKVQMLKLVVQLPVRQEQQKIADFLSSIDDKLNTVQIEIEQTQQFKKGLLQQMFV